MCNVGTRRALPSQVSGDLPSTFGTFRLTRAWSPPCATRRQPMNQKLLSVAVALAFFTASPLMAQTLVTWNSPVKVTAWSGALTHSSGCGACQASGAHSSAQLTGDGYAEFVPAAGQEMFAGLGNDLTQSTSASTINLAF